ncbi:DUF1028 domain-containing protein [Leptolyngbya sp. FACHB-711]|uniref:DUF1028 domain-containing protein n=1 Tax=Leptolyngbya sp. FACHB-711 TaxID=2692813 RepID=UPI001685A258|nr:DUF1028 domain-containing protein [Leptolyngbya sp. FACHB-711]MBD2023262.1 DUF1028 domain-containing protein [Leptolyngbya sp. FACHB-711]
MTFSIVAWDEATRMTGIAVSTKNLAVGALVPFAKAGVGAIATQGLTNPLFGVQGLTLLSQHDAKTTLKILLQDDAGRDHRQLHLVDQMGSTAAWTGKECVDWAGHQTFPYFSVAGNMLVNGKTIEAMAEAYQSHHQETFVKRLLLALQAGQIAGGDKRGRQSAALYVMSTEAYAHLDLRVDDHVEPVTELSRLYEESQQEYYASFRRSLPNNLNPAGIFSRELVDSLISKQSLS